MMKNFLIIYKSLNRLSIRRKTSECLRGFFFFLSRYSYCFALFQKSLTFPDAFILIKSSFFDRFISFTYYSDTQFYNFKISNIYAEQYWMCPYLFSRNQINLNVKSKDAPPIHPILLGDGFRI
jgi:hypothetical protein